MLREKGATLTGSRVYQNKEFLASTDAWFRPVNIYTGPDGALYVVDYYRQIIEHPEWMAEDVVKSGALYNGIDKGRLYRITPKGTKPYSLSKELKSAEVSNAQLLKKLSDPNIWWRRNAQRLLIDRNASGEAAALEQMVASEKNLSEGYARCGTLEGLDLLKPSVIISALKDQSAGVRENAVKLSEAFAGDTGVRNALYAIAGGRKCQSPFSACYVPLGSIDTPASAQAREKLLFRDMEDPWMADRSAFCRIFGQE